MFVSMMVALLLVLAVVLVVPLTVCPALMAVEVQVVPQDVVDQIAYLLHSLILFLNLLLPLQQPAP